MALVIDKRGPSLYLPDGVRIASGMGYLICSEDKERWCEHIEQVISSHEDAELVWYREDGAALAGEQELVVPMFPTYNLYTEVRLKLSPDHFAYKAFVPPGDILVGFLNEGEGRRILREMIFDWFRSDPAWHKQECRGSRHMLQSEKRWRAAIATPNSRESMAQRWSVSSTGMCLGCNEALGSMSNSFEDAVPDVDPKPKASW